MESGRLHLGAIIEPFLNAVFPRYCVSCKQEGSLLCADCFASFDDRVFKVEDRHLTMFAYGNPIIRDLIKAYKYDFDHSAFRILQRLAEPKMAFVKEFAGASVLVPVPLSSLRLRERGFNQAEEIAKWVGEITGTPVDSLLKRVERSGHQAEKTTAEREEAMKSSPFSVNGLVAGRSICLVDDVWTTGSTLHAAEETILKAGAKSVNFLTVAKG